MAVELPYLSSYKNVGELFEKIKAAKQPDSFTQKFLENTLGLKSTTDRPLIPLLRTLGFIDAAGNPTAEYGALKNDAMARTAIAAAIRRAYGPLFAANENAHILPPDQLKGLIAQVAGTDAGMTNKIMGTFNALAKLADFTAGPKGAAAGGETTAGAVKATEAPPGKGLRPEFHYNIQVHLPTNASEETYLNIFNALRRAFE